MDRDFERRGTEGTRRLFSNQQPRAVRSALWRRGEKRLLPSRRGAGPIQATRQTGHRGIEDRYAAFRRNDHRGSGGRRTLPMSPMCEGFSPIPGRTVWKGSQNAKRRFGHPFMEKVNPPLNYPLDSAPFDSGPIEPNWGEWVAFRCTWTSRILAEVAAWTKELNPEVAIEHQQRPSRSSGKCAAVRGEPIPSASAIIPTPVWSEDAYMAEIARQRAVDSSDSTVQAMPGRGHLCSHLYAGAGGTAAAAEFVPYGRFQ